MNKYDLTFKIKKNKANADLIECLRYAGIIDVIDVIDNDSGQLITVKCPKKNSTEAKLWLRKNTWHMFSLGIKVKS